MKLCSVEGCGTGAKIKGMCKRCYGRLKGREYYARDKDNPLPIKECIVCKETKQSHWQNGPTCSKCYYHKIKVLTGKYSDKTCSIKGCEKRLHVKAKYPFCPEHGTALKYKRHEAKPERQKYRQEWKRNPEVARRMKDSKLRSKFGLSIEHYDFILAEQNSKCRICDKLLEKPVVDHCYTTQLVRGILCPTCNQGIGLLYDSISNFERAIQYIKDSPMQWSGCWEDLPWQ